MKFERFLVTIKDHIAHVRINRPDKANALDEIGWTELKEIFETLDHTEEARVIVLSGEGERFCAGADQEFLMQGVLKAQDESRGHGSELIYHSVLELQAQVSAAEKCRKPVLAAIHNACVGGAVDIITACDICYATEDAFFTIAEIDLGIVADLGTLQRLPKILPKGVVAELAYTGRRMGAAEAKERGLVNTVYPDKETMLAAVLEIARVIASKSPLAIRGSKMTLNHTRDHTVEEGLRHIAAWNAATIINQDLTEAFTAMMQKREAKFRD